MKAAYPIVLTPAEKGYVVYVPDMDINTEGDDIADALFMAQDAIGMMGITLQDLGKDIPNPSEDLPTVSGNEAASYVLVDFDVYRKANDMRTVRKNVTLPGYLNDMAEKEGLNFSRVLQDALKERLKVS